MYSFDVFDTLITRNTANPWGIFALMKNRLCRERTENDIADYVIDNFFELRIHSEELVRKSGMFQNREEVTLHDIYKSMALCGCLDDRQIEYLCELEKETEIANVVGIDENIQRLKKLIEIGERVILISDMYLSADTISLMLQKADEIFKEIPLYVSSEYGARKTTGNLYRKVRDLERIEYEEWTHIGDNIYQDIEVPYLLGIKVELFSKAEQTLYEKKILEKYGDDSRLQLMIGAALRCEYKNETNAFHIGCRYAGPVLYSYAEWIVEEAIKNKTKRLYFIARDGYVIKKIVDVILKSKEADIRTKYIYGSRKAWRMASLSETHYNLYQLILWSHTFRIATLGDLAISLHVQLEDLYGYLPGTYRKNRNDTNISNQELEYIARKLSLNKEFKEFHLRELRVERMLAQKYLAQEIDIHDDYFAFVDVSGGGLTQGCLRELMKDRYPKAIHTFFFKIDRVNLVEGSITDTFMPGFLENNLTIEMMCRAPHGQTQGYVEKDGRIVPQLEKMETQLLIDYGFYEYERGILEFTERALEISQSNSIKIGSMRNVLLYMNHIAKKPSKELLDYFASMPSSESGRGNEVIEYAPRLTREEIKDIFLMRTVEPIEKFYKGTDLNYSVMRATEEEKEFIERCKREYDSAWGKLCRQELEREKKELYCRYGRAAFYPIRLLEEKVVLYGAGKFGQDLYYRLKTDPEHEVVLWVDKDAEACRANGLLEVYDVSAIDLKSKVQIVIAVMAEELADRIHHELKEKGVDCERIVWIQPYAYPGALVQWNAENIG